MILCFLFTRVVREQEKKYECMLRLQLSWSAKCTRRKEKEAGRKQNTQLLSTHPPTPPPPRGGTFFNGVHALPLAPLCSSTPALPPPTHPLLDINQQVNRQTRRQMKPIPLLLLLGGTCLAMPTTTTASAVPVVTSSSAASSFLPLLLRRRGGGGSLLQNERLTFPSTTKGVVVMHRIMARGGGPRDFRRQGAY